jgi:phage N-6-adenine-methyltransferase
MSLVRRAAKNHPQKPVSDRDDDRHTPPGLFGDLHRSYRFTLDAAASDDNALLPRHYTRANSGLLASWECERVFCNPPFSRLDAWLEKAWQEMTRGHCELVVMLLPANRTEQNWWQEWVEPYRDDRGQWNGVRLRVRFLRGRLRFGFPPGHSFAGGSNGTRPPFGCCLLTWWHS